MKIKKVILFTFLCIVGFNVRSQIVINDRANFTNNLSYHHNYSQGQLAAFHDYEVLKAKIVQDYPGAGMQKTGRVLTIMGGVLFISGTAILLNSTIENDPNKYYSTTEKDDTNANVGSYLLVVGVGMLIPGIIVWNRGNKKYNQHVSQQKASLKIKGQGLSLSIDL